MECNLFKFYTVKWNLKTQLFMRPTWFVLLLSSVSGKIVEMQRYLLTLKVSWILTCCRAASANQLHVHKKHGVLPPPPGRSEEKALSARLCLSTDTRWRCYLCGHIQQVRVRLQQIGLRQAATVQQGCLLQNSAVKCGLETLFLVCFLKT